MIVREIKDHRDEILSRFDWFNDYKDTRAYAVNNCPPETVELLDKGWENFLKDGFPANRFQYGRLYVSRVSGTKFYIDRIDYVNRMLTSRDGTTAFSFDDVQKV